MLYLNQRILYLEEHIQLLEEKVSELEQENFMDDGILDFNANEIGNEAE